MREGRAKPPIIHPAIWQTAQGPQSPVTQGPPRPGGTPDVSTTLVANTVLWRAQAVNAWGKAELYSCANGVNNRAVFLRPAAAG